MGNSASELVPQKTINAMVIGPPLAGKSTFIKSCHSTFTDDSSDPTSVTPGSQQLCPLGNYNNKGINLIGIPSIAKDCGEESQNAIKYCATGYRSHNIVIDGKWTLNEEAEYHQAMVFPNVALVLLPDYWVMNRKQTTKWLFRSYYTISISESAKTFINNITQVLESSNPRIRPVFIVPKLDVITYETGYSEKQILAKFMEWGNNNAISSLENNTFFVNSKKPDKKKLAKILNQASYLVDGLP